MSCFWCSKPATTQTNIAKGRKLQLVPVCSEHERMVNRNKHEEEERRKAAKEGPKRWW